MTYSDEEIEGIVSQLDELEDSITTDGVRPFHALDNARTALRQLLEERRWRPTSEAPKDGTPFIGEDRDGDMRRMFWHDEFEAFVSKFNRMVMAPGYTINGKPYEDHSPVIHYPRRWFSIPQGTTPPQDGED